MTAQSTNRTLNGAGVHHIAVRARDFDQSFAFYTDGLGFTPAHRWGEGETRAALLDIGDGNYLELFAARPDQVPPPGADVPPSWPILHLALRSTDVDRDMETVRALGAPITVEPTTVEINGKTLRIAFFLGPDGETLEFFQHITAPGDVSL